MTTEIDIKSAKGFVTIALIGAAALLLVVVGEYIILKIRSRLNI